MALERAGDPRILVGLEGALSTAQKGRGLDKVGAGIGQEWDVNSSTKVGCRQLIRGEVGNAGRVGLEATTMQGDNIPSSIHQTNRREDA